jgi:predicted DNA-binding antitoxin AbrB/MazE fold protein
MINSRIKVKAKYENNVLKPLEKLELEEGEEVEIEVKRASIDDFHGGLRIDQDIADEIIAMELWD